ncbi:CLUMA_CG002581, isoform A [Clunio marinus]|uniref:CLUMA_CG002581, isoform A n=1 Tax=Clunio marinus TaxID=568069 RepID=A0A1J1HNX1_9DIPT|nr:CLUMA_CG002581, isoform A [Clunio marinus]
MLCYFTLEQEKVTKLVRHVLMDEDIDAKDERLIARVKNPNDFSATNFKIALPNPPPQQSTAQVQSTWVDYATLPSGNGNGISNDSNNELPPLTEIKQEHIDDEYEAVRDVPVWHTAKSTSKITMYPSKEPTKIQSKRKLQQIQPKPPALTPAVMPPLTQIVNQKPAPKLIAVAVKKVVAIQPKLSDPPQLAQIQSKNETQSKIVIKKVSQFAMNTRRHSTGNSSKIVPTKELLESLKQENIIYQDQEDKPWYCRTCGRNYKWRNSLKQHIKNECGTNKKLHDI